MNQTTGNDKSKADRADKRIVRRRQLIDQNCTGNSFGGSEVAKDRYLEGGKRAGIAFSGGGIRSATISLGLAEGLASRGRLYGFDLMSTVSGGGYFGVFLRSLFVERKNGEGKEEDDALVFNRAAFADTVLHSLPDQQYFRSNGNSKDLVKKGEVPVIAKAPNGADRKHIFKPDQTIKNPLWWLRENGRYLAPDGMTDYNFALAFIIRNWITMMFALLIGMALFFSFLQAMLLGARGLGEYWKVAGLGYAFNHEVGNFQWSPLIRLAPFALLIWAGIGLGYWLSLWMKVKPGSQGINRDGLPTYIGAVFAIATVIVILWIEPLRDDKFSQALKLSIILFFGFACLSSIVAQMRAASSTRKNLAADFRREQTRLLAFANYFLIIVILVGIVDTLALFLRALSNSASSAQGARGFLSTAVASSAVLSIVASLVAKLPSWLGGSKLSLIKFLVAHSRTSALVAAMLMLLILSTLADMLVLKVIWQAQSWTPMSDIEVVDWPAFGLFVGVSAILFIVIGASRQFLNQTALAPLYGSRLTRSYLGGSNFHRLNTATPSEVTKGMLGDDLSVRHYLEFETIAPFHLINVTRNRTVGSTHAGGRIVAGHDETLLKQDADHPRGRIASYESSLTLRDRQGDRMVFGPEGVRAGAEFFDWAALGNSKNQLSLGQLCAVSGAAVSSGMGRNTSIGTAMALTLANVRLGQWWRQPTPPVSKFRRYIVLSRRFFFPKPGQAFRNKLSPSFRWLSRTGRNLYFWNPLHSYQYFLSELFARFDRQKPYWYLSDGGHSENSGALSLLERDCEFIIVADNGEDREFKFADLEVFVRSARTDIGMEIEIVAADKFPETIDADAKAYFFNGKDGDWRARLDDRADKAFALLLQANDIWEITNGHPKNPKTSPSWIVWLKPNRFGDLPSDLATYAAMNPDFPQQPTSNQFFDEAQWESYRRLGFEMARRLFAEDATLADKLPIIFMDQKKLRGSDAPPNK